MGDSRTPIEVDASLGQRGYEELARTLEGMGYEPRRVGGDEGGMGHEGHPHITLIVREPPAPDAVNRLVEGLSSWIRQRPMQRGRFRRRRPRPITVSVTGPGGEVLSNTVVERE
jgi:hypothetical protein